MRFDAENAATTFDVLDLLQEEEFAHSPPLVIYYCYE